MNRLQKKCLIASAALHGSLLLILVFGAALMPEEKVSPASRIIIFNPDTVTDGPTRGGGSPQIDQPQPPVVPVAIPQPPVNAPVQPPQPIQPPQPPRADPPKVIPVPSRSAESSFTPVKPKPAQTDDFTPVDHPPVQKVVANNTAAADAKAKAAADAQKRLANQINQRISHLSGSLSQATVVETSSGDDSGESAANYRDLVYSAYHGAWNRPVSLNDDSATVVVSVSIGRDGRVIRHEITKPSGNPVMDRSIEITLDNVTDIAPFPEGSKDAVRMYSITFILTAK